MMEYTTRARGVLEGAHDLLMQLLPQLQALRSDVTLKSDDTPVTTADLLVQNQLEGFLRSRLGHLTFVGEENRAGWEDEPTGWVAVVDPIDGTENFASSLPEWGTTVSIFKDGEHAASMLALPEMGLRIVTGETLAYAQSRVTAFSSGIDENLAQQLAGTPQARLFGAAVYNLYGVITGRLARFINPVGAYSWDLLAGLQLAQEHNCEVYVDDQPYDGCYLQPGRKYRVEVQHRHDRPSR